MSGNLTFDSSNSKLSPFYYRNFRMLTLPPELASRLFDYVTEYNVLTTLQKTQEPVLLEWMSAFVRRITNSNDLFKEHPVFSDILLSFDHVEELDLPIQVSTIKTLIDLARLPHLRKAYFTIDIPIFTLDQAFKIAMKFVKTYYLSGIRKGERMFSFYFPSWEQVILFDQGGFKFLSRCIQDSRRVLQCNVNILHLIFKYQMYVPLRSIHISNPLLVGFVISSDSPELEEYEYYINTPYSLSSCSCLLKKAKIIRSLYRLSSDPFLQKFLPTYSTDLHQMRSLFERVLPDIPHVEVFDVPIDQRLLPLLQQYCPRLKQVTLLDGDQIQYLTL